jgi:hypothetical protein
MFTGAAINSGTPLPIIVRLYLGNNEWIVGVEDGYMKMVKIRIMGPNTFTWLGTRYDLPFNSHCNVASTFATDCWYGPGAVNPSSNTYPVSLVTEVAATPTWRTVTNTNCGGRATGISALNDAIKSGTTVTEAQAACAASLACTGFQFHTTWGGGTTPQYFTDADETESTCYDNQQGWTAYFMVY